jgi:hypothetical protein
MNEMLIYLQESSLFSYGISSEQLMSALSSLEMLFSYEDDDINHSVPGSLALERSQKPEAQSERRDSQMERYDYFSIHESGNIVWCGVVRQNNCTEVEVGIGYAEESQLCRIPEDVLPELDTGKLRRYSKFAG